MGQITEPYNLKGLWTVRITRKNGQTYLVTSPDKQSIEDYRAEFLAAQKKRTR